MNSLVRRRGKFAAAALYFYNILYYERGNFHPFSMFMT